MLAPRFTLRTWIICLTVGSLLAIALREAVLGTPWAIGLAIGVGSIGLALLVQSITIGLSIAMSRPRTKPPVDQPGSPS